MDISGDPLHQVREPQRETGDIKIYTNNLLVLYFDIGVFVTAVLISRFSSHTATEHTVNTTKKRVTTSVQWSSSARLNKNIHTIFLPVMTNMDWQLLANCRHNYTFPKLRHIFIV